MGGVEEDVADGTSAAASVGRKSYWRSQSWSASRSTADVDSGIREDASEKNPFNSLSSRGPPLTPRSHLNSKARSCLPPLQPLSIARRSVDEWPKAGSDDVGEWPQPSTPSARRDPAKPGEELRVDISMLRSEGKRNQIAFFDKECSKVADHVYIGGDGVAKNREILRKNGITHVLNCVGFVCPEYFKSDLVYKTLWLQDSPSEDITSILYDVFDYFEEVREKGGRVLVHCCQGVSRSTSLVIAYLMWRKGQSFEDAFDLVKAARGIANPNMGFACQLLQCQKRVHAIPLSPNSVLRMYRMAPHSPYDALHLVPKMLNEPSPMALDSRGAFILHVLSSIYVWIGKNCKPLMEKDAKAAAYQVVRYERVPGPIYMVEEGDEPSEFWDAFLRVPIVADPDMKMNKEQIDSGINIGAGKRKVEAYDADFELFYKGLAGGVVPPFSSAGTGHETHLPARESNWSILRRKFISGGMKGWVSASKAAISRVYSDSLLARDKDVYVNRAQLLSVDSTGSPPYLSPSSLYSDSSSSSKSSSDSPSLSPSTSFPLMARSTAYLPDVVPSSRPSNSHKKCQEPATICLEAEFSPSKDSTRSLAERRQKFTSSLKLPTSIDSLSQSSRGVRNISTVSQAIPQEDTSEDNSNRPTNRGNLDCQNNVVQVSLGSIAAGSSEQCRKLAQNSVLCYGSSHRSYAGNMKELSNSVGLLAYSWPDLKKVELFCHDDLDTGSMYLILTPEAASISGTINTMKLYLWIGTQFLHAQTWTEANGSRDLGESKDIDWNQVGSNFLNSMGLQKDIPIKVVQEEESDDLWELLNFS